jgi:hypothetical protein
MFSWMNARRPLVRIIIFLVIGFMVATTIVFVGGFLLLPAALDGFLDSECESSEPLAVEGIARIKLPPSATNLQSGCGGLQGMWAEAYFDMKPSDLAVFVNSTNVKLPLSTTGKPETLECYPCNDLPNLKSYLYGTYSAEEWFEEIFIDTSNPARYRVYFTLLAG